MASKGKKKQNKMKLEKTQKLYNKRKNTNNITNNINSNINNERIKTKAEKK